MNETKDLTKAEPTYSQRFTMALMKEFSDEVGVLELSPYQKRLAQHMFVAIDAQLKALDAKRKADAVPIVWANINMIKLAFDAVHRVELGLDALIPNHIHPIPYLNGRTGKYDLDLRIGYVGKDCYRRKMAVDQPVDVVYELVHEKDKFRPIKKSIDNDVESYDFEIPNPFDRGQVVGGFGYIQYEDSTKNKLIIVTKEDFEKSKNAAQSDKFWKTHRREMEFKTLVHRTTEKIPIDPEKVNASFLRVEIDDVAEASEREVDEKANQEPIDIEPEPEEESESGAPLTNSGVEDAETTPAPDTQQATGTNGLQF